MSTLESKVKTRALKGIFPVHKWTNNTSLTQILCDTTCIKKILSFSSSFRLRVVFANGS